LNPRPHEAQLQDQKTKKTQEDHLEEEKAAKLAKGTKGGKAKQHDKEELRKAQNKKKTQKYP
jgi:hypothetical protein